MRVRATFLIIAAVLFCSLVLRFLSKVTYWNRLVATSFDKLGMRRLLSYAEKKPIPNSSL